jgi:CheY-like chemotaxis protein
VTPFSILHVDDDRFARAMIEASLDDAGYYVEAVGSAHTALAAAAEQQFDCYLIDLGLPEMDGLELAETLVQRVHEAPVVFVTGSPELVPEGSAVVAKPFTDRELLDALAEALASATSRA